MSDVETNAHEDKDVESASDGPGRTQEPLQSHTSSLKNNAAGLSSDEHENPLNGTQPNPFVYSSVPAVPHAGNSLPSGALVNGPGSHPTSEVHCVLNKGTVLSNNVLDAAWRAEKDTSPEVLPPPSELQSDAWKNTAGPVVKTLATQPGVNAPLSHPEENESKLANSALSGDGGEQMHVSQPLTKQTMKTRSRRDAEWSESSSDDYDDAAEVIRWDSERERLIVHDDRRLETVVMHQRDRKHNTHVENKSGSVEKVNNSLNHTYRRFCFCRSNDAENVAVANKADASGKQSDIKYSLVPLKDLSRNTASESEHRIYSTTQEGCNEENDPEDEDNLSPEVAQLRTEQVAKDPLFFSCTICNVNFKERIHFCRHMMYHLDEHNQVNSESVSQPFICRECGRLFCDSNSLMSHIVIHQDRLEKLMEEIKGLGNTEVEDRQCPQSVFGCNCPKIFVQHAKTHNNLKHYYFCEECNYITLTQQALEAHLHVTHLNTHRPQCRKMTHANDAEEADHVQFQHKMGFFRDKVVLERYSEPDYHQQSHCGDYKKVSHRLKTAGSEPNLLTKSNFGQTAHFPLSSCQNGGICFQKSSEKTVNSPQFKCRFGCTKNMLSPSLWRVDRNGKLLLQPAEKLDVATDLTCVEGDAENNDREASGSSKQTNCPATADFLLSARNLKLDQMFCQGSRNQRAGVSLQAQAKLNPPSLRGVSTPLLNTVDNMNGNISPRLSQRLEKQSEGVELQKGCEGSSNYSEGTIRATRSFLESSNERNLSVQRYFRKRQRFSERDQNPRVLKDEGDGDEDCSDVEQLVIKEECVETAVCDDSLESPCTSTGDSFGVELKPCPYCPAVFESGVGLSNHVRGHLHRVGLSYNARHMVSPEQVALQDHQPRVRRRVICGTRRMRKAVKPETKRQHTCPLCWGWFDTKTGLSNHVRGHLKRIGRSITSTSKSPLCILNELLRDQRDHRSVLQLLSRSHIPSRSFVSQKLISSNGQILMSIPVKIQCEMRSPHPILNSFVPKREAEVVSDRKKLHVEAQRGSKASSGTLVELLKMRRESLELKVRNTQEACATRKLCDYMKETQMTSVEPDWAHGECDSNEICVQCNSSFSGLPGHLRAFTHRRRISVFDGYDYKQKKPRPRPGLKKKVLPSLNAEIYTLTCRFCDLVFQGPPSVQEDWIRHLQRHLLHTGVPHSGTRMVEVLGLHHKTHISMSAELPDL